MAADIFAELVDAIGKTDAAPAPKPESPKLKTRPMYASEAQALIPRRGPALIDGFPEIPPEFKEDSAPVVVPAAAPVKSADRAERLEHLVDEALSHAEDLLAIPLIPGDDDFVKIASMKKDLVVSLLNTGIKVDENRFKKRQGDALTGILAQLVDREKGLQQLIALTPTTPN